MADPPAPGAAAVSVEDELKFAVPGLFELPDLTGPPAVGSGPAPTTVLDDAATGHPGPVGTAAPRPAGQDGPAGDEAFVVEPAGRLRLRATYLDTEDLRLARAGATLRHRTGEGPAAWHLKLPLGGDRARASAALGGRARREVAVQAGAGRVPARLAELVTAYARGAPLAPVAVLRTRRERFLLRAPDGTELAELVDDTVSVVHGRSVVARFRELELERRGLSAQATTALRERLLAAGAVATPFTPKLVAALGPRASAPPDVAPPASLRGRDPARRLVAEAVRAAARRLVDGDVAVRLEEPDAVHQMRVACRRLRSDLATLGVLVDPEWAALLRGELAWLAGSLGGARDLEVQRARLRAGAHADPLAPLDPDAVERLDRMLAERESTAGTQAAQALADPRYLHLLDLLVEAGEHPHTNALADATCRDVLPPLVAAAWDELAGRVDRLAPRGPDRRWHAARIASKQARYAAELVAPVLGRRAERLAEAASAVQDLLGEHQDAAVAAELMLGLSAGAAAGNPPDVALALTAARLAERERAIARTCRARLPKLWRERTRSTALVRWRA